MVLLIRLQVKELLRLVLLGENMFGSRGYANVSKKIGSVVDCASNQMDLIKRAMTVCGTELWIARLTMVVGDEVT